MTIKHQQLILNYMPLECINSFKNTVNLLLFGPKDDIKFDENRHIHAFTQTDQSKLPGSCFYKCYIF